MPHATGKINPVGDAKALSAAFGQATVGTMKSALNNVGTQYSKNTDADTGAPKIPTVGVDHATRMASQQHDPYTAAQTAGYHPLEEHMQPSGPRHPLGRSVPSSLGLTK